MEHCRLGSTGFSRIFGIRFPTPTPRACYLRSLGLVFGHSPPHSFRFRKKRDNHEEKSQPQKAGGVQPKTKRNHSVGMGGGATKNR